VAMVARKGMGKKKALLVVGGEVKEIYWNMKLILI
jgi:hypothetical protein